MRVTEDATQVVRIERTFDAPAEDVFDAWTSDEVIRPLVHTRGRAGRRRAPKSTCGSAGRSGS